MIPPNKKSSLLGFIIGWLAWPKAKRGHGDAMKKLEFKTSTRRIGITFTEKIRDIFRHKWLKKS
ncbi:MAG TPA: hypothetical protein VIJ25_12875 [Methylococcales bacterium]